MSRTLRRALLPLLLLPALVPAAANAEHASGPEPVGDELAWQVDPDDPFCGEATPVEPPVSAAAFDITGLSVRHKPWKVALSLRFDAPHSARSAEFFVETPHGRWMVSFFRRGGDRSVNFSPEPHWRLEDWDPDGDGTTDCQIWFGSVGYVPCDRRVHASLSDERDLLTVEIPRRCLDDPRWVRAGATSQGAVGYTAILDEWNPAHPDQADDAYNPNVHVYGPRVHAGPTAPILPVSEKAAARTVEHPAIRTRDGLAIAAP